jgi:uncharacterized membrane protein YfhO
MRIKMQHVWASFILLLTAIGIHLFYLLSEQKFSGAGDPLIQLSYFHYFLHKMFSQGNFFWSWEYGLGGDLFGQFGFYYTSSVFFWLSLLWKNPDFTQIFDIKLYLSILKSYLAMIFMFFYLRKINVTFYSSLIGALLYVGPLFFLRYTLLNDFMTDAMVWLPLVILGLYRYLTFNKFGLFVLAAFIMLISNFYFAYISTLFVGIFSLVWLISSRQSFKEIFRKLVCIGIYYIIALGMAAITFLPSVYAFLHADRYAYKPPVPLWFDNTWYEAIGYQLFFINHEFVLGGLSILILIICLLRVRGHEIIELVNINTARVMTLLLFIPVTYSVFNGFSAMQTRWLFLLLFSLAAASSLMIDYIVKEKVRFSIASSAVMAAILLFVLFLGLKGDSFAVKSDFILFGFQLVAVLFLFILSRAAYKRYFHGALAAVILLQTIYVNNEFSRTTLYNFYGQKNITDERLKSPGFDNEEQKEAIRFIKSKDKEFYRILNQYGTYHNTPMVQGYAGVSAYQSLISHNVHQVMKNHYNVLQNFDSPSRFEGLDNRKYLEAALGVKYIITPKKEQAPFGYSMFHETDEYYIWRNKNYLTVGFMYHQSINPNDFKELNFAQRDAFLLEAGVLPEDTAEKINLDQIDINNFSKKESQVVHLNKLSLQKGSWKGNKLIAEQGAQIDLPIQPHSEPGEWIVELKMKHTEGKAYSVSVNEKIFNKREENNPYAFPLERFVFNVKNEPNAEYLKLALDSGTYKFKEVLISFNSYQSLTEKVDMLREESLQNVEFSSRSLEGNINVKRQGLLYLSVPYSKGWNLKVDGNDNDFYEVNHAFIGVPLDEGKHTIELSYTTPLFYWGASLSVVSVLIFIIFCLYNRKKL